MTKTETRATQAQQQQPPRTGATQEGKSGRWLDRLRLLPVLMIVATLTFGVKLGNIWTDADTILAGIPAALAEDEMSGEAQAQEPQADAEAAGNAGGQEGEETEGSEMAKAESGADGEEWDASKPFSRGELQLLENLADRREELDKRAKEIDMRERVLQSMEKRIDDKIAEMKKIEAQVESYLADYDEEHVQNMESLVKMYESMKSKDAARIFEQLQMDILLEVAANMKERKMADIMAEMSPDAAKALTMEMATKKPIPLAAN